MRLVTKPILGLKSNLPHDDPSLYVALENGQYLTHCVDCMNIDLTSKRNACLKAPGRLEWSNSANAQATKCMGLFYLKSGSNTDRIYFDNGKMYAYDASRDPSDVSPAGVTLANDNMDLYSMIQFGAYIVFTDFGEHTPYAWDNGDANAAKLVNSGTEYKFRYLEEFQRRIIGAYSDQTNGDIEIRYTDALPTPTTSCSFPSANQIYVTHNDSITGIKKMSQNACFVVGQRFIDRIDYYPDYTTPFNCVNVVSGQGFESHHSLVNIGGRILGFNRHWGFVDFVGSSDFPASKRPLSEDIENTISGINSDYYGSIVGCFLPMSNEVAWSAPIGQNTPNRIFYFNILTGDWRVEDKSSRYIDYWVLDSDTTFTSLINLGYTTWESFGTLTWSDLTSTTPALVLGNTDGKLYYSSGATDAGSDYEGYRVEPILPLAGYNKTLLNEIWIWPVETGDFNIDVYYRGGDTEAEASSQPWTSLGSVSSNDTANPRLSVSKTARCHQIKWGTDAKNEAFGVNAIEYDFEPLSRY